MLQCQLGYEAFYLLVTELLVYCDHDLHGDLSLIRVAGIHAFLDFGQDEAEREGSLAGLLQLCLIFVEVREDIINDLEAGYDVPEVPCIVLVNVGGRLEQEVEKECAIILLDCEELIETMLCLPRIFQVSQTIQELDEHLLCVRGFRFRVHVAELLEGADVGFD